MARPHHPPQLSSTLSKSRFSIGSHVLEHHPMCFPNATNRNTTGNQGIARRTFKSPFTT